MAGYYGLGSSSGCEELGLTGSSSSYYYSTSGSSNSSSVENISTSSSIENGDQLTITFIPLTPQERCLSPMFQDVFTLDDNEFLQDKKESKDKSSEPSWYSDFQNSLLKTVTNDEFRSRSSSSTYSNIIQSFAGDGILLKSLEKGVSLPYLHLSTGSICVTPATFQDEHKEVKQGVFKEIKRVVPPDSWIKLESSDQVKSTWLFLGFKTLDKNNEVLEQSWKEWTGVRHLYLELRTDIHIRRISFFRRSEPTNCLETFTYIAFIEIGAISGKTNRWLIDFVQRARLERLQRTITVYEEIDPGLWETDSGIPQA